MGLVFLCAISSFDTCPDVVHLPLVDARLASTPQARKRLEYLSSCALGSNVVLSATDRGVAYEFPGDMGLAPQWVSRGLTPSEERWVSACMLARTNIDGVKVEISMRSAFSGQAEALQVSTDEARQFGLEEGTFFGNLFAQKQVSYVCSPAHSEAQREAIRSQRRLCALPQLPPGPSGLTQCGMVHVGECSPSAFRRDAVQYQEAIAVFLSSRPPASTLPLP
jgi:hypothetical protein